VLLGNALGDDVLGSLKCAVDHLGGSLKLIVVLGHSGCGAVSTAVDVFLNPAESLSLASKHILRKIVDRLLVVVHASARRMTTRFGADVVECPGYRDALIETSVVMKCRAHRSHTLEQQLRDRDAQGLRAVYDVYLLAGRQIWAPESENADASRLADPPNDANGFVRLADAVLRSQRIHRCSEHRRPSIAVALSPNVGRAGRGTAFVLDAKLPCDLRSFNSHRTGSSGRASTPPRRPVRQDGEAGRDRRQGR
jgi:hypothetical protein